MKVLTETDAIEIMTVLTESGFDVSKEEVTEGEATRWNVAVNEGWFGGGEVAQATQVLNYYGLPRKEDQVAAASDSGLGFPDPEAMRAKQLKDIERKIERQLRTFPGVARVSVNIVLPEDDDTKIKPYPASASVAIVRKEDQTRFTLEEVQNQVAKSAPDLQPQYVSVTMSYQPPPLIPRQDLNMRRRNRIMLYIGILLVVVLGTLLTILLLQTRRQRAELASLREPGDEALELDDGDDDAARLDGTGQGALDDRRDDGRARAENARRLPASADAGSAE